MFNSNGVRVALSAIVLLTLFTSRTLNDGSALVAEGPTEDARVPRLEPGERLVQATPDKTFGFSPRYFAYIEAMRAQYPDEHELLLNRLGEPKVIGPRRATWLRNKELASLWRIPRKALMALVASVCIKRDDSQAAVVFSDLSDDAELQKELVCMELSSTQLSDWGVLNACRLGALVDARMISALTGIDEAQNPGVALLRGVWARKLDSKRTKELAEAWFASGQFYYVRPFVELAHRLGFHEAVGYLEDVLCDRIEGALAARAKNGDAHEWVSECEWDVEGMIGVGRHKAALSYLGGFDLSKDGTSWVIDVLFELRRYCVCRAMPRSDVDEGDATFEDQASKKAAPYLVKLRDFFLGKEFAALQWDPALELWCEK